MGSEGRVQVVAGAAGVLRCQPAPSHRGLTSEPGATLHARASHPEDAELRVRDGGVERGFEADRQDAPGVKWIDDAVVPESGGGEVGRALALVGVEDRRLEGVALRI